MTDTQFNVLVVLPSARLGYAWADKPTTASYIPWAASSYNDSGQTITITRSGVGAYTVWFGGIDSHVLDGGNVQVTASAYNNYHCKVSGWGPEKVGVRCFQPNGTPVDTYYTVLLGS